jgi:hypothetical protein
MANQYDDDDFDLEDEAQPDPNGPANLRKALRRAEKEKKELAEQLSKIQSDLRERSVKEVLESKGVPSKVAKFIPSDVSTPEQIDGWLSENADVFGFQSSQSAAKEENPEITANRENAQRISNATNTAVSPAMDQDLLSKLQGAKTIEELNALTGQVSARFRSA